MAQILDNKDKKLLYYLSQNARMSDTKLSKLIKLSKNAIKYRKARLLEQGIIKYHTSAINLRSLRFHTFCLLLRFNEDIMNHHQIQEYIKTHPQIDWAITLSGQWDIFAEFVAEDIANFHNIISNLIQHFGSSLNTYQTFFSEDTLRVEHLPPAVYHKIKVEQTNQKIRSKKIHSLNAIDKRILGYITKNAEQNYVEIAKALNLTFEIVRYRLKLLEQQDTIIKYFSEINLQKIGFTEYLFSINLKNIDTNIMDSFRKHIRQNPSITYAFIDIASFQVWFMTAFEDSQAVDHFSRQLRRKYGTIIQEQNYHLVQEQLVFNLFPSGLIK